MWNPCICDRNCDEACRIGEYLDIKNCLCKKRLFDKLIQACEDQIWNTSKPSVVDKKVTYNCLMHTILLIYVCLLTIICLLLLVVISINGYYC